MTTTTHARWAATSALRPGMLMRLRAPLAGTTASTGTSETGNSQEDGEGVEGGVGGIHAMIEGGHDIEALRILGKPVRGEPGFYDWMRGLALHRAGDHSGADKAFRRYLKRWPGDIIGMAMTEALEGQE